MKSIVIISAMLLAVLGFLASATSPNPSDHIAGKVLLGIAAGFVALALVAPPKVTASTYVGTIALVIIAYSLPMSFWKAVGLAKEPAPKPQGSGSTADDAPNTPEKLMDQIEEAVTLPENAYPFKAYGRNYAFSGRREVAAVYLVPFPLFNERTDCVRGTGALCTKAEREKLSKESSLRAASMAAAGKRRFFASATELPEIADGGCKIVRVRYDLPTKQVISAACNRPR